MPYFGRGECKYTMLTTLQFWFSHSAKKTLSCFLTCSHFWQVKSIDNNFFECLENDEILQQSRSIMFIVLFIYHDQKWKIVCIIGNCYSYLIVVIRYACFQRSNVDCVLFFSFHTFHFNILVMQYLLLTYFNSRSDKKNFWSFSWGA